MGKSLHSMKRELENKTLPASCTYAHTAVVTLKVHSLITPYYSVLQHQRTIRGIYKQPQFWTAIHAHAHKMEPFFIACQAAESAMASRCFQAPAAVDRKRMCSVQWVVACEQASAARPRIKGLMFDVTSRAEVTNLRLHTKHCLLLLTYSVIKIIYGRASGYVSLQNNRKCMSCFGLSRSKELCFYFFFL